MQLNIRYYGAIREQVGTDAELLVTDASTITDILQELSDSNTSAGGAITLLSLTGGVSLVIAVNSQVVPREDYDAPFSFKDGDLIAIMPPFAGG